MPRTRSLAWAELKIGVISLIAVGLSLVMIFLLTGEGGFFWQRYTVKTVFGNVAGLNAGSPVRLAGVEVGSVSDVVFAGDRVEVVMEVGNDNRSRITDMSVASLGSVSLLGESAVDITASSVGTPVPEWGYVPAGPAAGSLTEVAEKASDGLDEITKLVQDLRAGRGSAGKLITDDRMYEQLTALLTASEQVAANINRGRGTLGRLATDPTLAKSLEASIQNLEAVTAKIRSGEGSFGKLLNDDAMAKSLTATTGNLETLTGRLNKGEGTAGKLFTDQELYNRLNSMADRLDKVTASLQQGQGTMGMLLQDKQLYEKLNKTVDEVGGLVAAIKADPRKYLNVRVSIF
jgi:phospholipid/cholesterol/gamma-HCH transport system substrate-binding protein